MTTNNKLFFMLFLTSIFVCCEQPQNTDTPEKNTVITAEAVPPLDSIVKEIETGNCVDDAHIGFAGISSNQWKRYVQLQKIAITEQLILLTDHKSPAVRCYAFQALLQRHSEKIFKIVMNHLQDTSRVEVMNGCLGGERLVSGFFMDAALFSDSLTFTKKEKKILDSISVNRRISIRNSIIINSKGKNRF